MRGIKSFAILLSVVILIIIANNCSNETPTQPSDEDFPEYFPDADGNRYQYDLKESDSTGVLRTGIRNVLYSGSTELEGIVYKNQLDTIWLGSEQSISVSNFRKTNSGVFYFIDTSEVISIIPDSLKDFITLQKELRFLLFPLSSGSVWPAYRVTISLPSGINFTALDIEGRFLLNEELDLNLDTGDLRKSAAKVEYILRIIQDVNQAPRNLNAFAWFADSIGLVKLEGNSVVLGALINGELNFDDSTKTINQDIVNFLVN